VNEIYSYSGASLLPAVIGKHEALSYTVGMSHISIFILTNLVFQFSKVAQLYCVCVAAKNFLFWL